MYKDGKPYAVIGLDAPQAATLWSSNYGCGSQMSDAELEQLFTSVPRGTVVGFWATQALAYNNRSTHTIDFAGIDRVFAAAERAGQLVAPVLETQQGYCSDGHFKDEPWYRGKYRQAFDDDGLGLEKLSYWDYLHLVVPRYRASPAACLVVPVSEPEASTCGGGRKGADCYAALTCSSTARPPCEVLRHRRRRDRPAGPEPPLRRGPSAGASAGPSGTSTGASTPAPPSASAKATTTTTR